jgi:hypothetical protein
VHQRPGGTVGAYFRQDVRGIVDRLLSEQLSDGGWNCDAEIGSTRSSFNTTICVLDALLEYDRTFGDAAVTAARLRGRTTCSSAGCSTGSRPASPSSSDRKSGASWLRFAFPTWWHYDVLRALDTSGGGSCARRATRRRDRRRRVETDVREDGPLETQYPGRDAGGYGLRVKARPSRWNTLRAWRVLDWYSGPSLTPRRVHGDRQLG